MRTLDHPRLLPKTCSCHSAFTPFTPAAKHQASSSEVMYACSIDLCHDSACAWQHHASTTVRPQTIMKDKTDPNSPKGPVSGRVIGCCLSIRPGHLWHASTPSATFISSDVDLTGGVLIISSTPLTMSTMAKPCCLPYCGSACCLPSAVASGAQDLLLADS